MTRQASAVAALVAWGALAFGAVYPWAFTPLFIAAFLLGALLLVRHRGPGRDLAPLALALALAAAAAASQLVPMPREAIQALSPGTDRLLEQVRIGYPTVVSSHPLSIHPAATRLGLAATVALSVLLLGLARGLGRDDAQGIVRAIAALGIVMAVAGLAQHATWNGRIYGFWTPRFSGQPFGPFINRNHFAGWMLMAIPLAFGYFCARIVRSMRHVEGGWRNRVIWFSSREATETVMIGFAVVVMCVGLAMTMSRSGMIGLLAAVGVAGLFVGRRQIALSRRLIVGAYLALLLIVAIGWTGIDRYTRRFGDADLATMGNRAGIWQDTWRMARDVPLTGTGLNTFGDASLIYQTTDLHLHFEEAHSDYLQLLAEGGLLLGLPMLLAIGVYVRLVRRRFRGLPPESADYWIRAGALTGIAAIAVQEAVEFSLQMPGNAALFVVLLALAARRTSAAPGRPASSPDMLAGTSGS